MRAAEADRKQAGVDGQGLPIDGKRSVPARSQWPSGGVRAEALDRSGVCESFDTSIRALNALTTFGVGQRIGIMAGSGVGKSVLLDMIAHGAEAVRNPTDYPYGERQGTLRDPGGHVWTLSQSIADVDPADWGGELLAQRPA